MADERLPDPLTPADCELQDFKFMPLDVARLRSSEQNSDVTPEANWAALMLWAASWHEVPAGSIPDNDGWIAKACGYVSRGTTDPQWETVREGALRKFVRCADGRLYHPVVAEKAREAWAAKLEQRWRTECGRIKKHNDRHELKGAVAVVKPSYDEWIAAGRPTGQPLPVPSDKKSSSKHVPRDVPRETGSKGQGEGQGQGDIKENPTGSLPAAKAPRGSKRCPEGFEVDAGLIAWALQGKDSKPPACPTLGPEGLRLETEKFRDWTFKDAKTDWPATWRTWMRNAEQKAVDRVERSGTLGGGTGETTYQRRLRERLSEATGGRLGAAPAVPTAPAVARRPPESITDVEDNNGRNLLPIAH